MEDLFDRRAIREGFDDLTQVRVGAVEELRARRLLDDDHPEPTFGRCPPPNVA